MLSFLVLSCFLGVTLGRPDVSLGYQYNPPSDGYSYGPPKDNLQHLVGDSSEKSSAASGYQYNQPQVGFNVNADNKGTSSSVTNIIKDTINTNKGGSFTTNTINQPNSNEVTSASHDQFQKQGFEPIITKHFYIHSAPAESADEAINKQITIGRPEKHYRIVFIKAPEYHSSAAQLSASYAQNEEKTIIYVLSKQPDALSLGDIATPAPTQPSKPEVYFIKYNTPEEAEHAQKTIQAKYDTLGGSTKVSDEGIASVQSVIGVLGGTDSHSGGSAIAGPQGSTKVTSSGTGSLVSSSVVLNETPTADHASSSSNTIGGNLYLPASH